MPRLDHAAFESDDPERVAAFYERVLGALLEAITYAAGDDPRRP